MLAQKNLLARKRAQLALLESRLQAGSPLPRVQQMRRELSTLQQRLEAAMRARLHEAGSRLAHLAQMLDSLSPLGVLQRGYAILTDAEGGVVTDAAAVREGDRLQARLASGSLTVTVDEAVPKD